MSFIRPIILFFFFHFFMLSVLKSQVFVNELMAVNSSILSDPDFGEYSDWFELYNSSTSAIDLSGYYLTDDLDNATKWQIPEGYIIIGKGHIIFWADGEDINNHCNFKLSKNGEAIGLFRPTGELMDSILFTKQDTDISFGRTIDGSDDLSYFTNPTPGAINQGASFDGLVFQLPAFSTKGGLYTAPFDLTLSSQEGDIRYTLDGAEPTASSSIYTTSIPIFETTVVRARVFLPGKIPGRTITQSYFLNENFEERKLPVVSVVTNPANIWDPTTGLYTQDFKPEWEYPINIELFENDGNPKAVFNAPAGIKINGNNSWQFPQKILGIYFRNDYGQKRLDYPVFSERERNTFDYLALRASGNDQGATFFVDGLAQALVQGQMDFELQGFRPASVYVNGEYLGLHNIRSKQNEEYFEYYFDLERGEFDLILNNGEVDEGDDIAFQELLQLINQDLSLSSNYVALSEKMDMENMIDYFITEIWLSNRSWGHNIKLWRPKTSGSKWRWVLKDVDRGFSGVDNNGIDYFTESGISPSSYEYARVILRQLMKNDDFNQQFASRFADHLFTTFHPNRIRSFTTVMQGNIEQEIPYQLDVWEGASTSYGDALPSKEHWYNEVEYLNTFSTERASFMYRDIRDHFSVLPTSTLSTICNPAGAGDIAINGLSIPTSNWSGQYFQSMPLKLKTNARPGHQFVGWSFATNETLIPKGATWKYLDNGSQPIATWSTIDFNDAAWNSGPAQLGYGDGDEQTLLSFGSDPDNKYISTYFRKTFTISNPEDYTGQLIFNILKDDGAVVYLNGQEIQRLNMPAGVIDSDTRAYHTIEKEQEEDFHMVVIETDQLQQGENVIAVEIHQRHNGSSDLSFDLELSAIKWSQSPTFSSVEEIEISLPTDLVLVANYQATGVCLLPRVIEENTTLSLDCSPYHALGEVKVLPGVSLIVEAGVEILMPANASIIVEGNLQINGTSDQKVVIAPNETVGASSWGHLSFIHSTDLSNLSHLEIRGASKGKHPIRDNAAISAFHAQLNIDHLQITAAAGPLIFSQYAQVELEQSTLHSEAAGHLLDFQYGTAKIINNDIRAGYSEETTALRLWGLSDGLIRQNKIYDLLGKNSNGLQLEEVSAALVENNFIFNCTDKGISLKRNSSATIINNTFVNCKEGVAIRDLSSAAIKQGTFYNNETAIRCFEKELGSGGGAGEVSNCILSNSSKSSIDVDMASSLTINYSLSDTEVLPGNNNLFDDPLFVNPTQNDFQLQMTSPGIDSGREGGLPINMGTHSHLYSAEPSIVISAIHYAPLDYANAEFIELFNPGNTLRDLSGYKLSKAVDLEIQAGIFIAPGEKILIVKDLTFYPSANQQVYAWENGMLDNGGETIRLSDANGIIVDQVIYDEELPWPLEADGQGSYLSLIDPNLDNHFAANWNATEWLLSDQSILESEGQFDLYPNPTSKHLFLSMTESGIENVEIFNNLGQRFFHQNYPTNKQDLTINTSEWPKGIYLVRVNQKSVKHVVIH